MLCMRHPIADKRGFQSDLKLKRIVEELGCRQAEAEEEHLVPEGRVGRVFDARLSRLLVAFNPADRTDVGSGQLPRFDDLDAHLFNGQHQCRRSGC